MMTPTPAELVTRIANASRLQANDDGTFTLHHPHDNTTFLVEIKVHDVTGEA